MKSINTKTKTATEPVFHGVAALVGAAVVAGAFFVDADYTNSVIFGAGFYSTNKVIDFGVSLYKKKFSK